MSLFILIYVTYVEILQVSVKGKRPKHLPINTSVFFFYMHLYGFEVLFT